MYPSSSTHNPVDFSLELNGFAQCKVELPTAKRKLDRQYLPAIPERIFTQLNALPRRALAIYLILTYRSRLQRSRTIVLTSAQVVRYGLTRHDKAGALKSLEAAGLIRVTKRGKKNPEVELLA